MLDIDGCLPKNLHGIRTTHTCELCGFEPKTKNKYREKQDHLVMKHFKQKVDKIFPHSRPYTCPAEDCAFTGKDKQALLRHYTGKHGILEKYLREALAENGIQYFVSEHGTRRKCSVSLTTKAKRVSQNLKSTIADLLPKQPLPLGTGDLPNKVNQSNREGPNICQDKVQSTSEVFQFSVPIKIIELQQQSGQCPRPLNHLQPDQTAGDSSSSFATESSLGVNNNMVADDDLTKPSLPVTPLPLDLITVLSDPVTDPNGTTIYLSAFASPSLFSPSSVISNKEVMWGSGPPGMVEASDTIPITYIETIDANCNAMMDVIDCDLLMPSIYNF